MNVSELRRCSSRRSQREQRRHRRALDRDVDELADRADAGGQDHGLEAVGAAHQLRRVALARAVDEHALALADLRREHVGGDRLLERDDLGEPALLVARATSSGSFFAANVRSRSEYANMNALSNRISRISSSVCAWSSSVSPEKPVRMSVDSAMSGIAARRRATIVAVVGDGVAAPHPLEHHVGARLHRQVDVLADLRLLGDRGDHVVGEVDRVGRREPDPLDAVDLRDRAEQLRERDVSSRRTS